MTRKNLAPILLFVYDRPNLTEATLQALQVNTLAKVSRLFIFSDGPKPNASPTTLENIAAVRKIIKRESWCGEVNIIEREDNKGLASSIITGVNEVISQFDQVIVLEDDIVVASGFLSYMNDGLQKYNNEPKIFGITGFRPPGKRPKDYNTFFMPIMSSWSWATWRDRWESVSFDGPALLKELERKGGPSLLDFNGYMYGKMLQAQVDGKVNSWAIRCYASMYLQQRWFLYPSWSLVQNVGFGSRATHTHKKHFLKQVVIEVQTLTMDAPPLELDRRVLDSLQLKFGFFRSKINGLMQRLGLLYGKFKAPFSS